MTRSTKSCLLRWIHVFPTELYFLQRIVSERKFTQGEVIYWVLFVNVRNCYVILLRLPSEVQSIAELHYQEFRRPVVRVWANTSQDADIAITMHSVCKNNVEYHRGSLWNDKRQSVTEWKWSCAAAGTKRQTRFSSSAKTIISACMRLAITCDTSRQLKYRTQAYHCLQQ